MNRPGAGPRSSGDLDYRAAGVDIDAGDALVRAIGSAVRRTHSDRVLRGLGHFGGFYRIGPADESATLVASIDGVGTKLKIAAQAGRHAGIGHDIVNHCVNDVIACGARPLCFLDYFATGTLDLEIARTVIEGIADACAAQGIALLGGETAEMPDVYGAGDYDVAGVIIGLIEASRIVDGTSIRRGDVLVGLPSLGFHTNGYSLIRAALRLNESDDYARRLLDAALPWDATRSLADALLEPHRSYLEAVTGALETGGIHGMAHITGGGLAGNLGRIIPDGLTAQVDAAGWEVPRIMTYVAEVGNIPQSECYRVFNMGIGFVLVSRPDVAGDLLAGIDGSRLIGEIATGSDAGRVLLDRAS
jgi:phosphoribosylformylglycinamidine cyclo-ligase